MTYQGWHIEAVELSREEKRVEFTSPDGCTLFQPVLERDTLDDTVEYVKRRIAWLDDVDWRSDLQS